MGDALYQGMTSVAPEGSPFFLVVIPSVVSSFTMVNELAQSRDLFLVAHWHNASEQQVAPLGRRGDLGRDDNHMMSCFGTTEVVP